MFHEHKKWFDCPQCHEEKADHDLEPQTELVLACKKCKKVFRKDLRDIEQADEYCPRCDNHYVLDVTEEINKETQKKVEKIEKNFEQSQLLKKEYMDERIKTDQDAMDREIEELMKKMK